MTNAKYGIIYVATSTVSNKSYIGQTTQTLNERSNKHHRTCKNYTYHFARALRKYKKSEWEWRILYANVPIEQLNNMEQWCIANYNTYMKGYNSTIGGGGIYGYSLSDETKAKISKANTGNRHSEETKQKMSSSRKGKTRAPFTEMHKRNISKSKIGTKHSKEHRKKNSDANCGSNNHFYGKKHSDKTKAKMSKSSLRLSGLDNHNSKVFEVQNKRGTIIKCKTRKGLMDFCKENGIPFYSLLKYKNSKGFLLLN